MVFRRRVRKALRKRRPARRPRRVPRALGRVGTGGFTISRRVDTFYACNSATAGTVTISNMPGSAAIMTMGIPLLNPVVANHYSVPFTFQFALDQIANSTDITNICDRYKLTNVNVKMLYNANAIAGTAPAASTPSMLPTCNYIVDHDDATLQTIGSLREKMGLKTKTCGNGKFISFNIKPRVAQVVGATANQLAVPSKAMYVNSAYPSVAHYGLKGYFENWCLQGTANAVSCWTFYLTYTFSVKDLQ